MSKTVEESLKEFVEAFDGYNESMWEAVKTVLMDDNLFVLNRDWPEDAVGYVFWKEWRLIAQRTAIKHNANSFS